VVVFSLALLAAPAAVANEWTRACSLRQRDNKNKENTMGLFRWAESKIRTFTVWDIGIIKVCMVAFALMIAKLIPDVLALDWYWYGLIFVVAYVCILARMFTKPGRAAGQM
jgi:hypothetical protein